MRYIECHNGLYSSCGKETWSIQNFVPGISSYPVEYLLSLSEFTEDKVAISRIEFAQLRWSYWIQLELFHSPDCKFDCPTVKYSIEWELNNNDNN